MFWIQLAFGIISFFSVLIALTVYVEGENMKQPLIEASVTTLQLSFVQRLYSSEISAKLGKITLIQSYGNSVVPAISTPVANTDEYLFFCKLSIVGIGKGGVARENARAHVTRLFSCVL